MKNFFGNFYKNFSTEEELKGAIRKLSLKSSSFKAHVDLVNKEIGGCLISEKDEKMYYAFSNGPTIVIDLNKKVSW